MHIVIVLTGRQLAWMLVGYVCGTIAAGLIARALRHRINRTLRRALRRREVIAALRKGVSVSVPLQ